MTIARAVWVCVALVPSVVGCALEKSENPLSPSVAGPIAGVEISAPKPLEPAAGAELPGDQQPVTLLLENAWSTGQRPLNYLFEVATDAGFANKVFTREGIEAGGDGRTSLRLSDALGTGRAYYWRAKAQDGANAGPYSAATHFNLFTPVAFQKPSPLSPVNNEKVSSQLPEFRWGNAPRVGSPGVVSYVVEVATSDTFANKLAAWQFLEQANETRATAPSALPGGTQLFWRVRAFDGGILGVWSDVQVFQTPVPVVVAPPPVPPGLPSAGGSCASQPTHLAVLQCRRQQFGHMNATQIVQFLRLVAKDLGDGGFPVGPFGLLYKSSGHQCNGFSCDIMCDRGSGNVYDVLLDSEGAQTPVWGAIGPIASHQTCSY